MYTVITVLIVIACILLILIVLVQNPKGGGLASNFSSSNQIMGVRKTTDFLEKSTWTLAGAMLVLCVIAILAIPKGEREGSAIQHQLENAPAGTVMPSFPTEPATTDGSATTSTGNPTQEEIPAE
ncbi:MAG: preprotein translocase subunit SecG [Culturomica sp.]|jgi:preprotein translocase subunit SecG|nr:preprotein translocase subunit SecG [Culturomica sp.]